MSLYLRGGVLRSIESGVAIAAIPRDGSSIDLGVDVMGVLSCVSVGLLGVLALNAVSVIAVIAVAVAVDMSVVVVSDAVGKGVLNRATAVCDVVMLIAGWIGVIADMCVGVYGAVGVVIVDVCADVHGTVGVGRAVAGWGLAVCLNRPNLLHICFGLLLVVIVMDLVLAVVVVRVLAVVVVRVVGVNGIAAGLSVIAVFVCWGLTVVCVFLFLFLFLNRPNRLQI